MRIIIELPGNEKLPSQGRNSGSIPDGSATAFGPAKWPAWTWRYVKPFESDAIRDLREGHYYRAYRGESAHDSEFVYCIGWTAARDALLFEDGAGDFFPAHLDEITIKGAP